MVPIRPPTCNLLIKAYNLCQDLILASFCKRPTISCGSKPDTLLGTNSLVFSVHVATAGHISAPDRT